MKFSGYGSKMQATSGLRQWCLGRAKTYERKIGIRPTDLRHNNVLSKKN